MYLLRRLLYNKWCEVLGICEVFFWCISFFQKKALLLLVLVLVASVFPYTPAFAQTSDSVIITATVKPARYIVIDKHEIITQIISNTKDNVPPYVCLRICQGLVLTPTPFVSRQYQQIITRLHDHRIGILYQAKVEPNRVKMPKNRNFFTKPLATIALVFQMRL